MAFFLIPVESSKAPVRQEFVFINGMPRCNKMKEHAHGQEPQAEVLLLPCARALCLWQHVWAGSPEEARELVPSRPQLSAPDRPRGRPQRRLHRGHHAAEVTVTVVGLWETTEPGGGAHHRDVRDGGRGAVGTAVLVGAQACDRGGSWAGPQWRTQRCWSRTTGSGLWHWWGWWTMPGPCPAPGAGNQMSRMGRSLIFRPFFLQLAQGTRGLSTNDGLSPLHPFPFLFVTLGSVAILTKTSPFKCREPAGGYRPHPRDSPCVCSEL